MASYAPAAIRRRISSEVSARERSCSMPPIFVSISWTHAPRRQKKAAKLSSRPSGPAKRMRTRRTCAALSGCSSYACSDGSSVSWGSLSVSWNGLSVPVGLVVSWNSLSVPVAPPSYPPEVVALTACNCGEGGEEVRSQVRRREGCKPWGKQKRCRCALAPRDERAGPVARGVRAVRQATQAKRRESKSDGKVVASREASEVRDARRKVQGAKCKVEGAR